MRSHTECSKKQQESVVTERSGRLQGQSLNYDFRWRYNLWKWQNSTVAFWEDSRCTITHCRFVRRKNCFSSNLCHTKQNIENAQAYKHLGQKGDKKGNTQIQETPHLKDEICMCRRCDESLGRQDRGKAHANLHLDCSFQRKRIQSLGK